MPLITPKRGAFPSPRSDLAAATPHAVTGAPPPQFIVVPNQMSMWGNEQHGDCVTAEEAFAKSCNGPEIFIPSDNVIAWAKKNGVLNGAGITQVMQLMQAGGFVDPVCTYNDGPYFSVDWTKSPILQSAIYQGPVKLGVAASQLMTAWTNGGGKSGWFGTGFQPDANVDHCVSLCGYGTLGWLAKQLDVAVPEGVDPSANGYALFTWNSIGIVDVASMIAVTHEAWLRLPTTVIQGKHGLYVFHQGMENDLWYSVFDGGTWAQDTQVPNVGVQASPSAVAFNGKLYVFHQGMENDLWYSVFDGVTWAQDKQVLNVGVQAGPCAVVYKSLLYVFHQGMEKDLWYSVFDGVNWAQDKLVPNVGVQERPSAVVFNDRLYVVHQGGEEDLWYSVFDGTEWHQDMNVPNVGISGGPSAVVANGKICVFHQGNLANGHLLYSVFNGTAWSTDAIVPNVGMAAGPSAVMVNEEIFVFHQGSQNLNDLWYSVFDSPGWLPDTNVPGVGVQATPSAIYWV